MCGILGIANTNGLTDVDREWIPLGLDAIKHRGPDDTGEWVSPTSKIAFGHKRLSVIDLSIRAHQPMHSQDSRFHLTFNGEIYNFHEIKEALLRLGHSFSTSSDSEVLLTAYIQWGNECLKFFNGQFAFAIADEVNQKLLLARDRAGEKPLYYTEFKNQSFAFASEVKALLSHSLTPKSISSGALSSFLNYGFTPATGSIVQDVFKLLPGTYLDFDLESGKYQTHVYWTRPMPAKEFKDTAVIAGELKSLLEDAIERQFIADVPVGVLLSGGLDSSIVTALATERLGKIKTYTATFPEDPALNEAKHAKMVSDYFSTDHTEFEIRKPSLDLLEFLGSNFDEPIFDASLIPTYLLSCQIKKSCTVALGGDGADELFGGYRHYSRALQIINLQRKIPNISLKIIGTFGRYLVPFGKPGHSFISQVTNQKALRDPMFNRMFDSATASRLFPSFTDAAVEDDMSWDASDPISSLTRGDFSRYLPNDILVKIDRYSMLTSLEMRSPFLDQLVVEYAHQQVPSKLKVDHSGKKIVLTTIAKEILPPSFSYDRKMGFTPPIISWGLTPEWISFMKGYLLAADQEIFNKATISKQFQQITRRPLLVDRLLSLTLFEIWRKKNKLNVTTQGR